jgi:predicted MPP superfamily phosphohydrolase
MTYVRQLMFFLILRRPTGLVAGAAALTVAGVVASVGVSALARRGRETGALPMRQLALMLSFPLFCLTDLLLLWMLPRLRLSFSPDIAPPLIAALLVRMLVFWGLMGATLLARWRGRRRGVTVRTRSALILFLVVNLGFSAVQIDAYVVEPLLLETTERTLAFDDLHPAALPVHVVHLSDLHIERSSFREATTVQEVNALRPDIIVLSGDYLNLSYLSDPTSAADFRRFIGQLQAPYGIFAVRGSVEPTPESMAWLLEGTDVVWLEQEAVTVNVRGQPVTLVGVACSHVQEVDAGRLTQAMDGIPAEAFTLLLYHSPDLVHEAAARGVDLYVGGHTHGGQLRLPFYGAIVTASRYGRRYASGLYEEGDTRMCISRGLGFEGGGMPRARFLCRPEIVSFELTGRLDSSP